MIVVDTSIWIEFLRERNDVVAALSREMIQSRNVFAVGCVFAELLQGAKSQRETRIIKNYWQNLPKLDETHVWIDAGQASATHKYFSKGIGLIDVFLLTYCKTYKLKIWSLDKKMLSAADKSMIYQPVLL